MGGACRKTHATFGLRPSRPRVCNNFLARSNKLGDEGATILCDALRESKVTKVQELDLSFNEIGLNGAKAVAAMAAVVPSLTKALVTWNDLATRVLPFCATRCARAQ